MQTHKIDPQIGACSGICAIIMPAARMQEMTVQDTLIEHKLYIDRHGQDMPEILNWKWNN
jgi:xylulose-5-phosphate/fructose-6-phosphate phosphoketolase